MGSFQEDSQKITYNAQSYVLHNERKVGKVPVTMLDEVLEILGTFKSSL